MKLLLKKPAPNSMSYGRIKTYQYLCNEKQAYCHPKSNKPCPEIHGEIVHKPPQYRGNLDIYLTSQSFAMFYFPKMCMLVDLIQEGQVTGRLTVYYQEKYHISIEVLTFSCFVVVQCKTYSTSRTSAFNVRKKRTLPKGSTPVRPSNRLADTSTTV